MDVGQYDNLLKARASKGDLVLVLGAGVNGGSLNRRNEEIKAGRALAEALCEEMGESYNEESLADVVSAFEHVLGRDALNKVLIREFRFTKPSDSVRQLLKYTWKRIYTFNYDDSLDEAAKDSVQRPHPYNGMIDAVEDIQGLSDLQVIYLHGRVGKRSHGYLLGVGRVLASLE